MNTRRRNLSKGIARKGAALLATLVLGTAFQLGGCGTTAAVNRFLDTYDRALDQFEDFNPPGF